MLLPFAVLACTPPPHAGPVVAYDLVSGALFDAPWPNDERGSGGVDMTGFPNPVDLPLIDDYVAIAQAQGGWGTSAPVYLRFDQPVNPDLLPPPERTVDQGVSILLLDLDPQSATYAARRPWQWEYQDTATTWQPAHLLAIAPLHGFPLAPRRRYALVVTTDLAAPSPAFHARWEAREGELAALADALDVAGIDPDDVAVATVFTTQDPQAEMAAIAAYLRDVVSPPPLSQTLVLVEDHPGYTVYAGSYRAPYFTHGERPYTDAGGGFRFYDDGTPAIAGWDEMRLSVCVPKPLGSPPPNGWPVAVQQHGTGGDYLSHCSGDYALEIANQLGSVGIVSVGIDQPLHGTRVGARASSDFDHFNFLNPESGRTNFRQGAADAIYLAHALAEGPVTFTLPDGTPVSLDPQRVLFVGHSQGALTGALAVPWFGGDVRAAVLSATGGELAITLVERKVPVDIADLLGTLGGFTDDEVLTPLHPLAGLVQQVVEVTDPVNAAPNWFDAPPPYAGDFAPTPVLLSSGTEDAQTPTATAEVLAAAARMPRYAWADAETSPALTLRDLPVVWPPSPGTVPDWSGQISGSAFAQWPGDDHFAIFRDAEAAATYRDWLQTAADGGRPRFP